MFLPFDLTPENLVLLTNQARAEGVEDVNAWARARLLAGVTPETQARTHPTVNRTLDAVDLALDDGEGGPASPHTAESSGGAMTFGMTPQAPAAVPLTHQPAAEGPHARTTHSSLATGPIATTEKTFSHPCRYLLKEYHANFGPNDSQGTCDAQGRQGSMCSWPPGAARSCASFKGKVLPMPPAPLPPRALR